MLKEAYTGEEAQQYVEDNEVTILKGLADNEFYHKIILSKECCKFIDEFQEFLNMVKEKSGLGPSAFLYDIAHYIPNAVKLEVDYISLFFFKNVILQ